jgi:hypothetical protein
MAKEQVLKDARGNKIGIIEARSDGTLVAKDARGNKVGEYDPKRDVTRDSRGNKVGEGNFLSSLLTSLH